MYAEYYTALLILEWYNNSERYASLGSIEGHLAIPIATMDELQGRTNSGKRKRPWNRITPDEEDKILAPTCRGLSLYKQKSATIEQTSGCLCSYRNLLLVMVSTEQKPPF
jgi:hypothetical protein